MPFELKNEMEFFSMESDPFHHYFFALNYFKSHPNIYITTATYSRNTTSLHKYHRCVHFICILLFLISIIITITTSCQ